jgi:RecA-family ATPase
MAAELRLRVYNARELLSTPAPPREWTVPGWIPFEEVSLLGGDGGTGKSTIGLQLCVASVSHTKLFGLDVSSAPAVYISCEDDINELHFRAEQIKALTPEADQDDLTYLHLVDLTEEVSTVLAHPVNGVMQPTQLFHDVEKTVEFHEAGLLVLDSAADLFGGNEIERWQVKGFVHLLLGLAKRRNCTVVLLAHPSVSGMSSGRGYSGSTGWNNGPRARMYLTKPTASSGEEIDPDLRTLELAKANRGPTGAQLMLRWQNGCFVLDGGGEIDLEKLQRQQEAKRVFLTILDMYESTGQRFSPSVHAGDDYAPKLFANDRLGKGIGMKRLKEAMGLLIQECELMIATEGPRSRPVKVLRRTEKGGGRR